jgi:hypothetical protein
VTALTHRAARWREGLVIIEDDPLHLRARAGGWLLQADAQPEPPHRLTGLRMTLVGAQVTDERVAAPPVSGSGAVPAAAAATAATGFGELGLAGLVLASGAPDGAGWVIGRGVGDHRPGAGPHVLISSQESASWIASLAARTTAASSSVLTHPGPRHLSPPAPAE